MTGSPAGDPHKGVRSLQQIVCECVVIVCCLLLCVLILCVLTGPIVFSSPCLAIDNASASYTVPCR